MSYALLSDHNLKVFADNYFTTIPLLDDLKQHQIWYAGTTRINCPSNWPLLCEKVEKKSEKEVVEVMATVLIQLQMEQQFAGFKTKRSY